AKCSVTVRLFNFLATWMETSHGSMASVANPFWRSRPFWRCTVVCVLSPSDAGFDLTDLEVANQLPIEMLRFLKCVSKTFPKLLADNFVGAHVDLVDHLPECGLDKVLAMPLTNLNSLRNDLLKWVGLASGYCLLAELRIIRVPDSLAARALVRSLAELLGSRGADLTPLGKELCLRVLELAAALGAQARDVLEALLPSRAWEVLGAQLCRHFAERASDYVPAALALAEEAPKMLTTVMSHMLQDKELTSRRGSELSLEVMRCWPSMERFWSEGTPQDVVNGALHMLGKLVLLAPEVGSPKGPHFERLFGVFLKLLERSGATLTDKVLVLDLLPVFASDIRPDTGLKLRDALEEMVAQHFPLDSSTLLPGAPEYLCYVDGATNHHWARALRLAAPGQLSLMSLTSWCGETKQQQLIEAAYKCGATHQGLLISARLSLASKLLPLLLKSCSKPALRHFFVDNVTAMVDAMAAKIRHGSEFELTSKIVALSCLEVLYSCCPKDDVTGKQSSVNVAFCRSRGIVDVVGNELTKEITKHANSAKKEVVRGDVEFADLWRQLRCAAYRLVVAVVSCTQTESQFYDVFVFQERPEKGEFLWNNLVDEQVVYTFPLEREALSQKSRHVVGVTEGQVPSPSFSGRMAGSLRGSSLAQEASQYSLSASGLAFWDVETVDSDSSKGTQAPAKEPVSRLKVMDLEDDALNNHECMASVCSVLCRMADLGIIAKAADEEVNVGPAPKWLTFLTNAIVGNHTTRNALCFLCRIIVNSAEVLRVHSRHLVPALLTVLADDKLGTELDAFVIDVAVTVLMWASDWSLEFEGCGRWCYLEETGFGSLEKAAGMSFECQLCVKLKQVTGEWEGRVREIEAELKAEGEKRVGLEAQVEELTRQLNHERKQRVGLEKQAEELGEAWKPGLEECKRECDSRVERLEGAGVAGGLESSLLTGGLGDARELSDPQLNSAFEQQASGTQVTGDKSQDKGAQRGVLNRVKGDQRVTVEVQPGKCMVDAMTTAREGVWDNREGRNLVIVHAGLNDVLKGRSQNLGKQLNVGMHKLRDVSENVHVVVCTIPEVRGQSGVMERRVFEANRVIQGMSRQLRYDTMEVNREVYEAGSRPFADGIHYSEATGYRVGDRMGRTVTAFLGGPRALGLLK
ncbi:hypothetical protein HPB47_026400, partial [Ixodes persulcatus]